ncbi:Sodium/calcium exchanger protein-domain-containing protein [Lineolata rhizophorae]|uniref:Sodium/calcium exchanger protein-domain-containing protein n=1 Tax=Lineolata rhizophorae TaxID=578093 RepID=A0A6A6P1Z5_9PEZI|nr:Sodium/calcium exchanger protein-domain-containing protein [Lineolata rhizophorae]
MADNERSRGESNASSPTRRSSSAAANTEQQQQQQQSPSPEASRPRGQTVRQSSGGYGTIPSSTPRQVVGSPEAAAPAKPKKPGIGRRISSHGPHKGQEFSVDDAEEEVEEVLAEQKHAKKATGSLRRMPSTIRRRPAAQAPSLSKVDSAEDDEAAEEERPAAPTGSQGQGGTADEEGPMGESEPAEQEDLVDDEDEDDGELSEAESFTLRDRQQAINETHPFGIRIWKPALYKKDRSVQKTAEGDIHSTPGGFVSHWLLLFNFAWTLLFGWWLAIIAAAGGLICLFFGYGEGCMDYGRVLWGLAGYIFYPFGKYVKLKLDEAYAEEDEGEGRSISEYEQWQSGDIEEGRLFFGPLNINRSLIGRRRNSVDSGAETQSLLDRSGRGNQTNGQIKSKRRLFGRGKWNMGRVIFFIFFYGFFTPSLFVVSGICWLLVFTIPMGKVTLLLFDHLRRHPLALSFHSDHAETRQPGPPSAILLCTYRAAGLRYWKYTIDGTNIFLINLLAIVVFAIFDYFVLGEALGIESPITNSGLLFILGLLGVIPLAYFIGQAVASISAQSSMGVGATVNAFFSTVVEVFLYCVALKEGKAQLVEGSIVGSLFAGVLFLPGLSMCFGALKRKTQRFNVKSAGVTSTMLLFAVIGAFGPTLFYQIYGSHKLNCHKCKTDQPPEGQDCRRCYFEQIPAVNSRFYRSAVRPYIWFCAIMLFLSYVIGLFFTLRTHAAVIWTTELDEKKQERMESSTHQMNTSASLNTTSQQGSGQDFFNTPLSRAATSTSTGAPPASGQTLSNQPRNDIRESQLYKRILGHSLRHFGLGGSTEATSQMDKSRTHPGDTPHVVPPRGQGEDDRFALQGLSPEQNQHLVRGITEVAATAAAVAARDATRAPRKMTQLSSTPVKSTTERPHVTRAGTFMEEPEEMGSGDAGQAGGGHDAPNWSRTKSTIILLTATVAYAVIAEILVNTVDSVLENVDVDEKFLGITLFALVPNTTEFLNAISFAMNGNIALSMEIGSAYALQVCLLQVPALVLFSAAYMQFLDPTEIVSHTFTLIFPQWDMVTVILCVFLLSYMYGEGKSNYFKGSILLLAYLVVVVGFYLTGFSNVDLMDVDMQDTLAIKPQVESFMTVGRSSSGFAAPLGPREL